jgi:hypothetical protein
MKKISAVLFLTAVLCLSVFADGDTPVCGKNCQPPVQCFTGGEPTVEKTIIKDSSEESGVFASWKNWLSRFFG